MTVPGLGGATGIVTGGLHTCARVGGGLACWGLNSNGQLGDNSVTQRSSPTDVVGIAAFASISGGGTHTCALTVGGGIRCWGGNATGQLGDGTVISEIAPVLPVGLAENATAVAAGDSHSCAVVAAGGMCFGDNTFGQIGDGTQFQRLSPVAVTGLAGATSIVASRGGSHSCAIAGGGAVCWGRNSNGQLGDNSNMQRLTPVSVSGLTSGVAALAAGQSHTCALTTSGGAKCWGFNANGQLGDGTQSPRLTPVDVTGLTSGITAVAAGGFFTCALNSGGGVKCWGVNDSGQLGDGSVTQRLCGGERDGP